ncbi:IS701 family transposase [Paludisphaera mucosa]|uniref:IS701 family transposase n=1 Tax=Paludisphaera mucosa TaxID=3030827 RepID=A0ABT6F6R3_9BACT|nr:IS701 family transposase [Paludisphaera mucosa]MDG3003212.1 IS701 family transposase [Paludisphaera mucosa]
MSLLDHHEAQALLADAVVSTDAVRGRDDRLTDFLQRYLPRFYRVEQRATAALVIRGRLGGLERKTSEPIAIEAGLPRKPIQFFVGSGKWDDESVMSELRAHVGDEMADSDGVVVVDGSSFPKKGTESCGVARQWCGRLGKVDNCQVGVFLAYAAGDGYAPLDRRLYLPEDWSGDAARREKRHVPPEVAFRERWQIALEMLDRSLPGLAHGWIAGDDEFGRASEFRAALRRRKERYALDVPCNTTVRDLERRRPPRKRAGVGRKRETPFVRADAWAASRSESRWERIEVRDGEKGPLVVDAMTARVRTRQEGRVGPEERLVVIRVVGESRIDYALTDAGPEVPLAEVVRAQRRRHRIEEMFEAGNGEAGLDHYEVRSWVGWRHHMTLSLVALWFLCLERRRVGGGNPGDHRAADAAHPGPAAPRPAAEPGGDRPRGVAGAAA